MGTFIAYINSLRVERHKIASSTIEQEEKRIDFAEIKQKAQNGDLEALFELGRCYGLGWGVEKDQSKHMQFVSEAAGKNYTSAVSYYNNLYQLYKSGVITCPQCAVSNCLEPAWIHGYNADKEAVVLCNYHRDV